MPVPYSTGMGDRLRMVKPPRYLTRHPGQLSHTLGGTENEYRPKCSTLCGWEQRRAWLIPSVDGRVDGVGGRSICDPLLTRAVHERLRNESDLVQSATQVSCSLWVQTAE